jgi:hypothetical protein
MAVIGLFLALAGRPGSQRDDRGLPAKARMVSVRLDLAGSFVKTLRTTALS